MEKRTKKISVNLTKEQYALIEWLATKTRRSISELAFLILVDNSQLLFNDMQEQGDWLVPKYVPQVKLVKVEAN